MPKQAIIYGHVTLNSVDLSDHVRVVATPVSAQEVDISAMGDVWDAVAAGTLSMQLELQFLQNYDAAKVDATLWPIITGRAAVTFAIRASSQSGVSATNPQYTGSAVCLSYQPLNGTRGQAHEVAATFKVTGAVTRATA